MASITLDRVVKDYGAVRAIRGVDLAIADGEFVAFVGPSGCGKSTLLRMIAGLEEITAGIIRIGDRVVNDEEPKDRDIAMVFQDYALYPHMSVAENIGFGLKMRGLPADEIAARVAEAAGILQIEQLLARKPGELSGGQRQRVAMGRAIVRRPKVFLFDEPLSNLDARLRVEMRTQIKRLHRHLATTTIYVTHDQVEAMTLADRVVILKDGIVMQEGGPIDVYTTPQNRFVGEFIGSPHMNMLHASVVQSPSGSQLVLGDHRIAMPELGVADGTAVVLGIRPEHLHPCQPDDALLSPMVDVFEPLGSDTMAICLLDGQEITVRLDPEMQLVKGQTLHLAFEPHRLHLFSASDGARLGSLAS